MSGRLQRLRSLPARTLISLVRAYQATLSVWIGGQCRFWPTCSEYFVQAVRTHGALRGGLMGLWRILRCNPFCKGGFDPVPDRRGRLRRHSDQSGES